MHLETRQLIENKTLVSANYPQNRSLNRYRDVLPCMNIKYILFTVLCKIHVETKQFHII